MFISGVRAGDNEGWDFTCHDVGVLDTWEGLEHVMRKSSRGLAWWAWAEPETMYTCHILLGYGLNTP